MNSDFYIQFFKENISEFPNLLNSIKSIIDDKVYQIKNENIFVFLNILEIIIKDDKMLQNLLEQITTEENKQIISSINEQISTFINDEKENIINYLNDYNKIKELNIVKLVKFECKIIGLSSPTNLEKGNITPKILVKLFFNNGTYKIVEFDYNNFKKLNEELEDCLNGFRGTYARRIENFSK